jgi:hypothetical protein
MTGKDWIEVSRAFNIIWQAISTRDASSVQARVMPFHTVTTDDGPEFTNQHWQQLLRERGIRQFIKEPGDRFSLGVIDRVTRTIKTWLEDWQIQYESLSWVTALPEVMHRYNSHVIRTLGASPQQLRDQPALLANVHTQGVRRGEQAAARYEQFQVGDTVRIRLEPQQQPRARAHKGIAKGVQRWSNAVYRIVSSSGFSFELQDTAGRPALRTYRQHELMKVPDSSVDVPDLFAGVAREARRARRLQREGMTTGLRQSPD